MLCDISYDTKNPRKTRETPHLGFQPQCNYECHNLRYPSENECGDFRKEIAMVNITIIISLLLLLWYNTLIACGNLAGNKELTQGERLRR